MASVTDLVGPLVAVPGTVPAAVRAAATSLCVAHAVRLDHLGPLSVTASVIDGDGAHRVALGATAQGLASSCDCERGAVGLVCAHSLAAAIEIWHTVPRRRDRGPNPA